MYGIAFGRCFFLCPNCPNCPNCPICPICPICPNSQADRLVRPIPTEEAAPWLHRPPGFTGLLASPASWLHLPPGFTCLLASPASWLEHFKPRLATRFHASGTSRSLYTSLVPHYSF
jgi:hypothetical protein